MTLRIWRPRKLPQLQFPPHDLTVDPGQHVSLHVIHHIESKGMKK